VPGELADGSVYVGQSVDGSAVALVLLGTGGDRGSIWSFDPESVSFAELDAPLPPDRWIFEAQAITNQRFSVIEVILCSAQPEEGDAGPDCTTGDVDRRLLVLDRQTGAWNEGRSPSSALANVDFVEKETVVLEATVNGGRAVWSVSLPSLAAASTEPPPEGRCMSGPLRFHPGEPSHTTALRPDAVSGEWAEVALPEALPSLGPGLGDAVVRCHSSGSVLGVPADPGEGRPLRLYDLDRPGSDAVVVPGVESVNAVVASGTRVAVVADGGELHLVDLASGEITSPVDSDVQRVVRAGDGFLALRHGSKGLSGAVLIP